MSILKIAVHPGRILREEYLEPLELSSGKLAKVLGVPRTRIERLVKEETSITTDTALRLGKALKTTPEFWINLQTAYDLAVADKSVVTGIKPINRNEAA
ncbi:HigA family addiction module antitoxin [Aquisalinus flavus]|uniref:Transcriptional regulator n=1 Tax=Aquisalinus flavus TaxID=1526572 RepID=A0A8J2V1X6_9PROT|nr:HigA family addiction module antitoxin [Aquisalinus flavus]MBD0426744.1 HigA family addiction module antidote protein [Aquisalinus flavus]UNE46604.1 HigA family addiction module antidote protein [Aquisalinus flavus]GGC95643.1 transcriptional regulator [Aquisalinus flavus]